MNLPSLVPLALALVAAVAVFALVTTISKLLSLRRQSLLGLVNKFAPTAARSPLASAGSSKFVAKFGIPKSVLQSTGKLGERLSLWVARRAVTNRYQNWLAAKLQSTGSYGTEAIFAVWGSKIVSSIIGLLAGFALIYRGFADALLATLIGALAGFVLPDISLLMKARKRTNEIEKQLPDVVDLMRLCLLAGLSFEATTARISVALDGPLAEEIGSLNLAVRLGKSRLQALAELMERSESKQLRQVIGALMQVERLGVSVNAALNELARESREVRRANLREKGQKVAVKILMPLLFCFLPAMMIIVLGPALVDLVTVLGSL
jgi:tight adherence protein C